MAKTLNEVRDEITDNLVRTADARSSLDSVEANLQSILLSGWVADRPLPAQSPTEDQIVAALKADPAMAGRVIAVLAVALSVSERGLLRDSAGSWVSGYSDAGARGVQSLAVALAAASYRG